MSTVPSLATRVDWGVNTSLVISGVTYKGVSDIQFEWGYVIHEEKVTGTNLPYLGAGVFHGEGRLTSLASNDSRWEGLVTPSSGIVPTFGLTWQEGDTTATGASGNRTWTISGKFSHYEKQLERDNVVHLKARFTMATEPTVVNS